MSRRIWPGVAHRRATFLFIGYLITILLLYGVATATGKISSYLPVPGAPIAYYADHYVSSSLEFTLGCVY